MNWYFYKVWIPLSILTLVCCALAAFGVLTVNWYVVFTAWFLVGPVGMGVGFHRLFGHRQFETWRPIELALAVLGTLSLYAPLFFFASLHQRHHRVSDLPEDPSSPAEYGFWESFLWYRMRESIVDKVSVRNACAIRILKDKKLLFLSFNFTKIVWLYVITVALIDVNLLLSMVLLPALIEHTRVNLISSLSHTKVPFSYRNYDTPDKSYNNFVFGLLSMGFGWHNNHHQDQQELVNHHRWWELDVEGLIGKLISKRV